MASPPLEPSGRKSVRKAIRHGYDRFKQAVLPSSRPPSRGSAAADSRFLSPTSSQLVSPPGTIGRSPAPSTLSVDASAAAPAEPARHGPTATGKLMEAGTVARSGLEAALRVLEKSADAFPPLKLAVGGFVDCLDIIQAVATNVEEYEALTAELTEMATTLNQYLNELGSEDPTGSAARIALSIQAEVAHIGEQQGRGKGRRIIESAQDREDIIQRYHRIEGLFRQLQGDMVLRIWRSTNEQHVTTLLRGMCPIDDARYNSSYSTTVKRRGCTAETREKVQSDLQDWVGDPNAAKVYWMNGMAGTGKTTIAYSLCQWLEENQRLGASFFCSRVSSSCRNVNWIIPTIAYQLARYSPAFQSALFKVLKDDPDASKLNVVQQFEKLVRGPLMAGKDAMPEGVVIVLDALDECEDDYGVRLVLGTLLKLGANLPVKFFVTSRPEPAVRANMLSPSRYPPAVLHLHDIEKSIVEEDIKKYLREALSSMAPPPSGEQIEQLAKHAGNLFIYAATAVRYILPGKGPANPISRLNTMLVMVSQSAKEDRSSNKYKELDELYSSILSAAFNGEQEEVEALRLILWTAVCAKEPMTIPTLASLLNLTQEQATFALEPLRSVLHVSEGSGLVSTLHASFPDYMLDHLRSRDFYCDQAQHSEFLAHHCFDIMKEQLRFNICELESSFVFDKDVPDLEQRIRTHISPTLFYSCRYWGDHLRLASASKMLCSKLVNFLAHKLLFWMEVLTLRLCVVKGIPILIHAENWLLDAKAPTDVYKQVNDARDFVTRFAGGACSRSTPHIYLSALPFCAKSSSVYAHYWGRTRGLMDVRGTAINRRDKAAQATWMTGSSVSSVSLSVDGARVASGLGRGIRVWDAYTGDTVAGPFQGHTSEVNSVAFSPDGTRIVSGSRDETIRVWDAHTGDTVAGPFQGHTGEVNSVAFSPDGTRIVSGSDDDTIRVWDAHTGDTVARPFQGHTSQVKSVAFSPDGTRIVSGSNDKTIRVWDAYTGDTVAGPFQGHTSQVKSVAFSPDGTRIASGSNDKTIRVWDAHTGDTVAGPFQGHTEVNSVAFSPDGARIVSGSDDYMIRVWDVYSSNTPASLFKGHTYPVNSVAFSPDGARIFSSSGDATIRMWNAQVGETVSGPFGGGHTHVITSVAFSPDGGYIASGSYDHTVRVFDAYNGDTIAGPFQGHADWVRSVACSPDGTRVVSGSDDATVRVWDAYTGDTVAGPFRGHEHRTGWVNSVAFSPDGTRIVSGSRDETIRVWDAHTGDTVAGPFQGHTGEVNSVAFSPDGTRIVSGSYDKTIRVWDAHTGNTVAGPFQGHTGEVNSVAFSPDGTRIVSGSDDDTIRVWDAHTGDTVAGPFQRHTGSVTSVAFSPDGSRIVSGSGDETIRVWDARTGDTVAGPFQGHIRMINSVAFSPDGTRVVSCSDDETIRMWNLYTGDNIAKSLAFHANSTSPTGFPLDSTRFTPSTDNDLNISSSVVPIAGTRGFMVNDDGWVTTNDTPLFWASPDLHVYVPSPHNASVIGPQGSIQISYQGLALGEKWSECYIPE